MSSAKLLSVASHLARPALALLDTTSTLGLMILAWSAALRFGIPSPAGFAVIIAALVRWLALEVLAQDRKPWQKVFYRSHRDQGIGE